MTTADISSSTNNEDVFMSSDDDYMPSERHWKRCGRFESPRFTSILEIEDLNKLWCHNFGRKFGETRQIYMVPEDISEDSALGMLQDYPGDRCVLALFVQPVIVIRSNTPPFPTPGQQPYSQVRSSSCQTFMRNIYK